MEKLSLDKLKNKGTAATAATIAAAGVLIGGSFDAPQDILKNDDAALAPPPIMEVPTAAAAFSEFRMSSASMVLCADLTATFLDFPKEKLTLNESCLMGSFMSVVFLKSGPSETVFIERYFPFPIWLVAERLNEILSSRMLFVSPKMARLIPGVEPCME